MPQKPIISIIVAVQKINNGIGNKNDLLWRIPGDLKRFKAITTGHPIVMGRNTFFSIGKPLPNRTNIVLSKVGEGDIPECVNVNSPEEAIKKASEIDKEEIFIVGGAQIYKLFLPLANRLYITLIDGAKEADTFFPDFKEFSKVISEEKKDDFEVPYSYVVLEK